MIKTLIVSSNNFIKDGLQHLLPVEIVDGVHQSSSSAGNLTNIADYDLIFMEIQHHQLGLCLDKLKQRKKISSLFFIQTGRWELNPERFLGCCQDAMVLRKNMTTDEIKALILYEMQKGSVEKKCLNRVCKECFYPYLTRSQLLILLGLKHGYSVQKIAESLNVSKKTIFSQIEKTKLKFNLKSDFDIKCFVENNLESNKPINAK